MKIKKKGIPEEGDVVLATVVKISPHAAFVRLEEYEDVEGLIHISEIAKTWVKNIKNHLRVNQQVVCKVIEVKESGFVHLSMRRVSDYDKRAKWDQIKRAKRVENIIEMASKKLKKNFLEIYERLKPLEKEYGEIYFAFEEARKTGKKFLKGKIPDEWIDVFWDLINKSIALPRVEIRGILTLRSFAGDGINRIKEILAATGAEVKYLGAPRYMLKIEAHDYKKAEKELKNILEKIEKKLGKTEVMSFERLKR